MRPAVAETVAVDGYLAVVQEVVTYRVEPAETLEQRRHALDGVGETAEREAHGAVERAYAHGQRRLVDAAGNEGSGALCTEDEQHRAQHHQAPAALHGEAHEAEHDDVGYQRQQAVPQRVGQYLAQQGVEAVAAGLLHPPFDALLAAFRRDGEGGMHQGDESHHRRYERRHQVDAVVDPGVADIASLEGHGLYEAHDLVLVEALLPQHLALHGSRGQHAHGGQLLVAQRACQQVGRVVVEHELRRLKLQHLVVCALGYLVEGEDLAPLHGAAGLHVVVVYGVHLHARRGVQLVAYPARQVAPVQVHHAHRQPLRLAGVGHRGKDDKRQHRSQRQNHQVARLVDHPPAFPLEHPHYGILPVHLKLES